MNRCNDLNPSLREVAPTSHRMRDVCKARFAQVNIPEKARDSEDEADSGSLQKERRLQNKNRSVSKSHVHPHSDRYSQASHAFGLGIRKIEIANAYGEGEAQGVFKDVVPNLKRTGI